VTDAFVSLTAAGEGVLVVTLDRPSRRNALNRVLLARLAEVFSDIADQASAGAVRAVVLTGSDPAFCAGLDLTEIAELGLPDLDEVDPVGALTSCGVPVIGAVNGPAATGGLELALGCDFLIASDRAAFADTHARVGVVPGWGLTARLPAAVGPGWARQMSATGNWVDAQLALRIGLVNEVVPHAQLLTRAVSLAVDAAGVSAEVLGEVRDLYDLGATGGGGAALAGERAAWARRGTALDPAETARRRDAVIARGSARSLT
jgi:enoyl-CoA hydratase